MSARIALSLVLALASAVALNWAFYRQHAQTSISSPLSLAHPLRSLWSLFSNRRWLVGFVVGILGWVFYVAALGYGPLSLVQAASAGGIGVLALLVWRWGGVTLVRRELIGVATAIGGLRGCARDSRSLDTEEPQLRRSREGCSPLRRDRLPWVGTGVQRE